MKLFSIVPEKFSNIICKLWPVLCGLFCAASYYLYHEITKTNEHPMLNMVVPVAAVIMAALSVAGYIGKCHCKKQSIMGYLVAGFISVYASYRFISFSELNRHASKVEMLLSLVCCVYVLLVFFNSIISQLTDKIFCSDISTKQLGAGLISGAVISFLVFFYIPAESFFGNFSDYAFPYQIMIRAYMGNFLFWTALCALIFSMMKKASFNGFYSGLSGAILALYAQYMLFNRNIGSVDGTRFNWTNHSVESIINILVWGTLIIGAFSLGLRKKEKMESVAKYIAVFVGLIHIVTYATLLIQADEKCYSYAAVYYSYENQFKVATDENIVVFIVDALDNDYAMELYEENAPVMEAFTDFTMYTNTCSVYDYTSASLLQMMTNYEFDNTLNNLERRDEAWNTQWATEFYDRLHDAGYKIEVFNFDNEDTANVIGKIDNAMAIDSENNKPQYISYKSIRSSISKLTNFTICPNIFKGLVSIDNISFTDAIVFRDQNVIYENDDFANNLRLTLADEEKLVLYQHTMGCHAPYDNVDMANQCLLYVADYINQMKALGVYDNATIIITADHGKHDDDPALGRFASTPMLMIKRPGEISDAITLNSAPVYHTDFMASILDSAKLYSDGDENIYGKPFWYYGEDESRVRTWYDRVLDSNYTAQIKYNTYYGYEYSGDEDELKRVVLADENLTVYPVPRNND